MKKLPLHLWKQLFLQSWCFNYTLAEDTRIPLNLFSPVAFSAEKSCSGLSCRSNIGIEGQKRSEKWWSSTNRLRRTIIGMFCMWLYSMGIEFGILPALTGLLVDQARLCADPQATLLIFLPGLNKKYTDTVLHCKNYYTIYIYNGGIIKFIYWICR